METNLQQEREAVPGGRGSLNIAGSWDKDGRVPIASILCWVEEDMAFYMAYIVTIVFGFEFTNTSWLPYVQTV